MLNAGTDEEEVVVDRVRVGGGRTKEGDDDEWVLDEEDEEDDSDNGRLTTVSCFLALPDPLLFSLILSVDRGRGEGEQGSGGKSSLFSGTACFSRCHIFHFLLVLFLSFS